MMDMLTSSQNRINSVMRKILEKQNARNPWNGQFIYVIRCDQYIKIGIATNPKARLSQLQVGCPYPLTLLRYWPSVDAGAEEDEIHALLDQYRHNGEWFKLPDDVLARLIKA